ncbi:MAG: hypothetical protein QXP58_07050 [Thermoprotei archaeon]
MAKPEKRILRVYARREFLDRMYYATGIFMFAPLIGMALIERRSEPLQLYSKERIRSILVPLVTGRYTEYIHYLGYSPFKDYTENVDEARLEVRDWRGIP